MAEQARCGLEKGARLVDSRALDPGEGGGHNFSGTLNFYLESHHSTPVIIEFKLYQ
jgi:hypothetical protein